jgi:hypothetical protein
MGGYSSCSNYPNYNAMLANFWGAGQSLEFAGTGPFCNVGFVFGSNPPFYLDDFLAIYPKFFGLPTALSGAGTTQGSAVVSVPSTQGLQYGQFMQSYGVLPKGSVIVGLTPTTITLNQGALVASSNATLMIYEQPPIPTAVIQLYLQLAVTSLVQARWGTAWTIAVCWFIAHYLTLYAKTDESQLMTILQTVIHGEVPVGAVPGTVYTLSATPPGGVLQALTINGVFQTPGISYLLEGNQITLGVATYAGAQLYATWPVQQETFGQIPATGASIAAQGLAGGIQTSKSIGDVSVGYQALASLEDWGQWQLTTYGQQLSTMAKVIGMGPVLIY